MTPFLHQRSNGYYCVVYEGLGGKRTKESLRTKNKKAAKRLFTEWIQDYEERRRGRRRSRLDATFRQVGDHYLKHIAKRKSESWARRQKLYLEGRIYPFFGEASRVRLIGEDEIEAYLDHRVDNDGIKKVTANKELSCLRQLFAFARGRYVERNPAVGVPRLREDDAVPHDRVLTVEEADRLIAAASPTVAAWIMMGISTGMRPAEQRHLQWDHIDLADNYLTIRNSPAGKHHTKTLEERVVPIVPTLRENLRRFPRHVASNLVFFGRTGGPTNLKKGFAGAVERAKLMPAKQRETETDAEYRDRYDRDKVTPHTLRHTYATRLAEAGFDPYTVMRWTGHKLLETVQRYITIAEAKRTIRAVDGVDEVVFFGARADREGARLNTE